MTMIMLYDLLMADLFHSNDVLITKRLIFQYRDDILIWMKRLAHIDLVKEPLKDYDKS